MLLAIAAALLLQDEPSDSASWTFEGHVEIEGHYARPGDVRRYRTRVEHVVDPTKSAPDDAEAIAWTVYWTDADAPRSTTRVVRRGADVWIERDGRASATTSSEPLRFARALLALGDRSAAESVDEDFTHGRLGDVRNSAQRAFGAWPEADGALRAHTVVAEDAVIFDEGVVLRFALRRAPHTTSSTRLLAPPTAVSPPDPRLAGPITIRALGVGLFEALVPNFDSRVLVLEVGDGLAVLQAPGDSWTGEALLDALTEAFPTRPVRWVVPTHHHPYSMGAVRAFVAAGATVVTTPGNEACVRALCAAPFTLQPDRLAAAPEARRQPVFAFVDERFVFGDARARVIAYDIGARSQHTDEHLVLYLPRHRILFHGDLGWHPDGAGGVRVGSRASALLQTIATPPRHAETLDVARIYQSWPVLDVPAALTPEELAGHIR